MSSIRAIPCVNVIIKNDLQTKFCRIPPIYARELGTRLCVFFEGSFLDELSDLRAYM